MSVITTIEQMGGRNEECGWDGPSPVIVAGNAIPQLSGEIARRLGLMLCDSQVERFGDGEVNVRISETVRGRDVYIIQSSCPPVNDNLMELLLITDALRRASAKQVTAVIPYFGYARQDRKHIGRVPISAKLVANLIKTSGVNRVVTLDLHAGQIQGFFDIPVDNLRADQLFVDHFSQWKNAKDASIVSPDIGGVKRARVIAEKLNLPLVIIEKRRECDAEKTEVLTVIGDVKGKRILMIDDIMATGRTMINGLNALVEVGANENEIWAAATHPVLNGNAVQRLKEAGFRAVVTTNSIPLPPFYNGDSFFKIISIGGLLAEVVTKVSKGESVSEVFPHD